jgi:hypothetical protein
MMEKMSPNCNGNMISGLLLVTHIRCICADVGVLLQTLGAIRLWLLTSSLFAHFNAAQPMHHFWKTSLSLRWFQGLLFLEEALQLLLPRVQLWEGQRSSTPAIERLRDSLDVG